MWDSHKVSVAEANEALDDDDAVWFDPDPKSTSGQSIRVIGYSPSRQQILTIILVREPGVDWLWGANGWVSNSTDRAKYRQGSE
ncbi:MAG: transposase [Propionibacteriales bacterium]|nr:transposase [Propionibacteriales bacterium]